MVKVEFTRVERDADCDMCREKVVTVVLEVDVDYECAPVIYLCRKCLEKLIVRFTT